uniref:Uncharacterized protein n=1 Tax=Oryza barthii TaxID=65489 RepID=A0A0D3FVW8_9ORYZ
MTALRCSGRPTRLNLHEQSWTHQIGTAKDTKPRPLDGIHDGVLFVATGNDQVWRALQWRSHIPH